jgi:hypothetical protein
MAEQTLSNSALREGYSASLTGTSVSVDGTGTDLCSMSMVSPHLFEGPDTRNLVYFQGDSQDLEYVKRRRDTVGSVSADKQFKRSKIVLSDQEISSPGTPSSGSDVEENRLEIGRSGPLHLTKFLVSLFSH